MDTLQKTLINIFGVPFREQTYLNMLYLFLAFPLGVFYFVFLVTGLSLGLPLIILWIGIPILLGVFAAWYALCRMERSIAIRLLGEEILPMTNRDMTGKSLLQKLGIMVANPVTWKGLLFLVAKFPLGIISFSILVLGFSLSLALLAAPFYYQTFHPIIDLSFGQTGWVPDIVITSLDGALILSLIGILITIASLHIINGLAWISGKFARIMLGNYENQESVVDLPVEKSDTESVVIIG
jgi:hypothetical protein